MQHYHIDTKGILEYINELEDTLANAEQAKNPITDATLILIVTNAMLST